MIHRGGGPFGAGRLQSEEEILSLEQSLLNMVDVIKRDSETSDPVTAATSATAVRGADPFAEPKKSLPPLSKPAATTPPAVTQPVQQPPRAATPPVPMMMQPPVAPPAAPVAAPAPPANGPEVIPIAVGLDRFLAAPEKASLMEMTGLRDGLIECLSLLQKNIQTRMMAGEILTAPGVPSGISIYTWFILLIYYWFL